MAQHAGKGKDFYRILNVSKTSTTHEIKSAYRKLAMALHPDRNEGDPSKTSLFKEASEAYDTLSDHKKRTAYDMMQGHDHQHKRRKPPPNYRKVYSPRPPPGFKTFDPKKHYDMHYGDGMMKEEVERAFRRAKEAAGKEAYTSPIGPGFSFSSDQDRNPYSRKSTQQGPKANGLHIDIEYEEAHFYDSNSGNMSDAKRVVNHREHIRGRLHDRRRMRVERQQRQTSPRQESGCSVM
jgi:DnaJ-class molecular chaperone